MAGGGDRGCSGTNDAKTAEIGVGRGKGESRLAMDWRDELEEFVLSNLVIRDCFDLFVTGTSGKGRPYGEVRTPASLKDDLRRCTMRSIGSWSRGL